MAILSSSSHRRGIVSLGTLASLHKFRAVQTKLVMFIHDVPPIMFPSNYYLMPNYIEMYNLCDVVVVPSEQMRDRLIEEGLTVKDYYPGTLGSTS